MFGATLVLFLLTACGCSASQLRKRQDIRAERKHHARQLQAIFILLKVPFLPFLSEFPSSPLSLTIIPFLSPFSQSSLPLPFLSEFPSSPLLITFLSRHIVSQ